MRETPNKKRHSESSGSLLPYNKKPGKFTWAIFITDRAGKASKRAVFYSIFAFLTIIYLILSMTPLISFSYEIGGFLFAFLTENAVVYHKKNYSSVSEGLNVQ